MLYFWDDWKRGGWEGLEKLSPAPRWGILKHHPDLQKKEERKQATGQRECSPLSQAQLELIHNTTS
jgi:hypothetical protein